MNKQPNKPKQLEGHMFVPIDIRDSSLYVKKGRHIDKAVTWAMVLSGVAFFIFLTTFGSFMDITGLNFIATLATYLVVFSSIIYFIASKFIFKIDDKMKQRALEGSDILSLNLGNVWRIRAGGVRVRNFTSGEMILVNYDGKPAFIFKRVNGSVEGQGESADKVHYKALERINDLLVQSSSFITKLNLKDDTQEDEVWDYQSRRLYNSDNGQQYTEVMKALMLHRYEFTKRFSTVTTSYYIVVCKPNTSFDELNQIYEQIKQYNKFSISKISLVKLNEFQNLLTRYYGINNIDLAEIMPTSLDVNPGDSKVLDIVDNDGRIIIENLPEIKLPDIYSTYPEHLKPMGLEGPIERENEEELDIFSRDYI